VPVNAIEKLVLCRR